MKSKLVLPILIGVALLATGCKKSAIGFDVREGQSIRFSARSSAANTKTVYNNNNGEYFSVGTQKFEGIDWVENDALSIAYIYAGEETGIDIRDYKISGPSTSQLKDGKIRSTGTAVPVDENDPLVWHNSTFNQFYASYPAVDTDDPNFLFTFNGTTIRADVPFYYPFNFKSTDADFMTKADGKREWAESMKYAYINSFNGLAAPVSDGSVRLELAPHFMAWEIEARAYGEDEIPLKGFTITSGEDLIGGTFFLSVNEEVYGDTGWYNIPLDGEGNTSNSIHVDFSDETEYADGGLILTHDNPIKLTVFSRGGKDTHKITLGFDIIKDGQLVNRSLKITNAYNLTDEPTDGDLTYETFYSNCKNRIFNLEVPLHVSYLSLWYEGTSYAGSYINDNWED